MSDEPTTVDEPDDEAAEAATEAAAPYAGPPQNVIAALARVEAEIGGIAKLNKRQRQALGMTVDESDQGVKWPYRGIDQIAAAAQPLLGRYGVVIVPKVKRHIVDELMINSRPWTDTTVEVKWTIYGPGGVTDKITAFTVGLGRDNSDKGYNKAMTVAYKNLLLRLLSIGDPKDDIDHSEGEGRPFRDPEPDEPPPPVPPSDDDPVRQLWNRVVAAGSSSSERGEGLKAIAAQHDERLVEATLARHATLRGEIERQLDAWDAADREAAGEPAGEPESAAPDAGDEPSTPETEGDTPETADDAVDGETDAEAEERRKAIAEAKLAEHAALVDALPEREIETGDGAGNGNVSPKTETGDPVCVDCGGVGHEAMDCPNPPQASMPV